MRLLLVNYSMDRNSPVLAWQQRLASELARSCERVVVLTEERGDFESAENLDVHCVPRAFCRAPLRWLELKWLMVFPVALWCRRHRFDACFVHMNAAWVYRLWPCLRAFGVPTLLWYAHGTATWRLRLAHRCADRVVTSTPEGFRIPSRKVEVIGQAIDTETFRPPAPAALETSRSGAQIEVTSQARATPAHAEIAYVGRIAPRKRIALLVDVLAALVELAPQIAFRLRLVGPTLRRRDREYAGRVRDRARRLGVEERVAWDGPVASADTALVYRSAFVHLNVSQTGSMDKTVLEALACGCPVLTSNEAFRELLAPYPDLFLADERPEAIARNVLAVFQNPDRFDPVALRSLVVGHHDLASHVRRILATCTAMSRWRSASGRVSEPA
jgi:glycosyltransferase involved in cell wall biosynthesis